MFNRMLTYMMTVAFAIPIFAVEHEEIRNFVETNMAEYVEAGGAASVLVVQEGTVVIDKGFGLANPEKGYVATPETIYPVGSITKQFTGAAITHLAAEGKLDFQDSITEYFEDVPEDKANITLHQLLTHTAGLADTLGSDKQQLSNADFLDRVWKSKLLGPPGEMYRYSNVGYSLLGMIVEDLEGIPYPQFLNDTFFTKLGMTHTGELIPRWDEKNMAIGYRGKRPWGTLPDRIYGPEGSGWHLRANGGLLSTTGDMYRWHKALLNKELFPDAYHEAYLKPYADEGGGNTFYAYGWARLTTKQGDAIAFHNGSNGIFFADCLRHCEEDSVIIILVNNYKVYSEDFGWDLLRLLFGK